VNGVTYKGFFDKFSNVPAKFTKMIINISRELKMFFGTPMVSTQ
jgi:hypothetical protein